MVSYITECGDSDYISWESMHILFSKILCKKNTIIWQHCVYEGVVKTDNKQSLAAEEACMNEGKEISAACSLA